MKKVVNKVKVVNTIEYTGADIIEISFNKLTQQYFDKRISENELSLELSEIIQYIEYIREPSLQHIYIRDIILDTLMALHNIT